MNTVFWTALKMMMTCLRQSLCLTWYVHRVSIFKKIQIFAMQCNGSTAHMYPQLMNDGRLSFAVFIALCEKRKSCDLEQARRRLTSQSTLTQMHDRRVCM